MPEAPPMTTTFLPLISIQTSLTGFDCPASPHRSARSASSPGVAARYRGRA
jgi:hypothetical protein